MQEEKIEIIMVVTLIATIKRKTKLELPIDIIMLVLLIAESDDEHEITSIVRMIVTIEIHHSNANRAAR